MSLVSGRVYGGEFRFRAAFIRPGLWAIYATRRDGLAQYDRGRGENWPPEWTCAYTVNRADARAMLKRFRAGT